MVDSHLVLKGIRYRAMALHVSSDNHEVSLIMYLSQVFWECLSNAYGKRHTDANDCILEFSSEREQTGYDRTYIGVDLLHDLIGLLPVARNISTRSLPSVLGKMSEDDVFTEQR